MAEERVRYNDPNVLSLASNTEQELGLPSGLLASIITRGERSNSDQVSGAGARGVTQIIPATRDAAIRKFGIDPYLSTDNSIKVAGLLLKDSLTRNNGDIPSAIGEYHGGVNRDNWGPITRAYIGRVTTGLKKAESDQADALGKSFDDWLAKNPAVPVTSPTQSAAPSQAGKPSDALLQGFDAWVASEGGPKAGMAAAPAPTKAGGIMTPEQATAYLATQPQIPLTGDKAADAAAYQRMAANEAALRQKDVNAGGLVNTLAGGGEAALSLASGLTTGQIGGLLAGGNRVAQQVMGALQGKNADEITASGPSAEEAFSQGTQALTYTPRTQAGQQMAEKAGSALQEYGPAMIGVGPELASLGKAVSAGRAGGAAPAAVVARAGAEGAARDVAGESAATGVGKAIDAGANIARAATTLPRRAMEMIQRKPEGQPTPGTLGSAGAAATDAAAQRIATAEGLGFTGDTGLTTGQATRDSAQLKFETETAKLPGEGKPLRDRTIAQNNHILSNFDTMIDQTGAKEPTLRAVGQSVDNALRGQYARDTTQVRAAYAEANRSPEASAIVDQTRPVSTGEGDSAITGTPLTFLNEQPRGLPNSGLADAARQMAVRTGVAIEQDGQLIPRQATIRQMEEWRKAINASTGYEPTDIRTSTILKALIDGQTEPVAGPLYRQARGLRARLAQNYEDRAVINKLLTEKPGTSDRRVAFEDVLDHTMLKGSLDDVRNVRRVLQRSGPEGQQAWRELQGGTLGSIRDQAFKNVATDSSGNRIVSPAALEKAIKALDADGRLDFIFGKQGAQTLRDLNEIVKGIRTVPPEAAINMSNTASTLMTMLDYGASTMIGAPAPVVHGWLKVRQYIKDRALRKRIDDALNRRAPRP